MNNIESNFVPYQIALDMKSIGFDEPCIYVYLDKATIRQNCGFMNYPKEIYSNVVKAPLYQQTFKFFREKYDLTSEVPIEQYRRKTDKKWMFSITYLNEDAMYEHSKTTFETYEEAELECLKKLIEIAQKR